MTSERQLRANRINALKSTGPRSEAGKERSARNALVHGLTGVQIVLEGEDPTQFEALRGELFDEFAPGTVCERHLVEQLAGLLWRLRRVPIFEAGLMTWISHCQDRLHDKGLVRIGRAIISADQRSLPAHRGGLPRALVHDPRLLGRTLEAVLGRRDLLSKISRYEAQLRGQALKILAELDAKRDVGTSRPVRACVKRQGA